MGGPGAGSVDFFISYTGVDRRWAEWIAWQLEEVGYSTRLQAWDFAPGSDFVHEMQQGVTSAGRTIAVLSPEYLSSPFGQAESRAVFAMDPSGEQRLLVGVRVRDCQPAGLFATRVWIDMVDTDEDAARTRLLEGLRARGARPSRVPRFPGSGPGSIAELSGFPRELPEVWNVPYHNPSFTGRDELLTRIHHGFAGPRGTIRCQVLAGFGGAGKTQLAVEYAHWRRADYDLVWWVRADDPATLIGDYTALGDEVGLEPRSDQDDAVAAVRSWLGHARQRWLLVLDGAVNRHVLQRLVARTGDGHVLVTSRNDVDWHGVADLVAVDLLSPEDATELLLARTGETDRATAARLATALGYLPLALEQAGALIAQTRVITLADYLDLFERSSSELLARGQPSGGTDTVATTWDLSLERLRSQSPAAVELLELAAFLAPEDLPWRLLLDHPDTLPPVLGRAAASQLEFGEVIVALRRYSLAKIAADGDGLIVHQLLQAVIRGRLDGRDHRHWLAVAVRLLERGVPAGADRALELGLLPAAAAACHSGRPRCRAARRRARRAGPAAGSRGGLHDVPRPADGG
jgi:TIR domain/NB-ARC domain